MASAGGSRSRLLVEHKPLRQRNVELEGSAQEEDAATLTEIFDAANRSNGCKGKQLVRRFPTVGDRKNGAP